jgi:hypothetical protein
MAKTVNAQQCCAHLDNIIDHNAQALACAIQCREECEPAQTKGAAQATPEMQARAQAVGIDPGTLSTWLSIFGPFVLDAVLKIIERLKGPVSPAPAQAKP